MGSLLLVIMAESSSESALDCSSDASASTFRPESPVSAFRRASSRYCTRRVVSEFRGTFHDLTPISGEFGGPVDSDTSMSPVSVDQMSRDSESEITLKLSVTEAEQDGDVGN